jgi:nitrate/nitrite transporter NarK
VRFGFTNEEAGHISSLPYIIASFATPLLGSMVSKIGEHQYETLVLISTCILFGTQLMLTLMKDAALGEGPSTLAILPIAMFGIGHALYVTVHAPMIK